MTNTQLNKDDINNILKTIPLKKIGTTKNISDLVTFLCSEESDYINGQLIKIDGGQY